MRGGKKWEKKGRRRMQRDRRKHGESQVGKEGRYNNQHSQLTDGAVRTKPLIRRPDLQREIGANNLWCWRCIVSPLLQ
jgi:hypothetical protein